MKMKTCATVLLTTAMLTAAAPASAAPVTFILSDNSQVYGGQTLEDLDGLDTMTLSRGGITAILTGGNADGVNVSLNATSLSFGINSTGLGDDTARLDGDEGDEFITLSFSTAVFFKSFTVSSLGTDDKGSFTFSNGASGVDFTTLGTYPTGDVRLNPGETATIAHVAGNGFTFDSFTVQAVPTPSAGVLALLGLGGLQITRRRRA